MKELNINMRAIQVVTLLIMGNRTSQTPNNSSFERNMSDTTDSTMSVVRVQKEEGLRTKTTDPMDTTMNAARHQHQVDNQRVREDLISVQEQNDRRAQQRREEERLKEERHQQEMVRRQQASNVAAQHRLSDKGNANNKSIVLMFNFTKFSLKQASKIINKLLDDIMDKRISAEITVGFFGSEILLLNQRASKTGVKEKEMVLPMVETKVINAMRQTTHKYISAGIRNQPTFIFVTNATEDKSAQTAETLSAYVEDFGFNYILFSGTPWFDSSNIMWWKFGEDIGASIANVILRIEKNRL